MECPIQTRETAGLLLDYCARRLDPETAGVLERHFAGCESCRSWADSQKAVWEALDAWEALPVAPDFDRRLYTRIRADERPAGWKNLLESWALLKPRPVLSLAFASALVLAALFIQRPAAVVPTQNVQVETVDAERLEKALEDVEMLRQLNLAGPADSQAM